MNLPITLIGRLADCVQLTYRTPAESVRPLLPDGLELAVRGPWAFWNVMACRVEHIRPAGVPAMLGLTYHHVAYRLLVQAMNDRAEVVRGLHFLRSEVDARAVSFLGNRLTDLRMHPASISFDADDCGVYVQASKGESGSGSGLLIDAAHAPARLADGSCFPTIDDARAFCRHTPNALAVAEHDGQRLLRTTRVSRASGAWSESPVVVRQARLAFLESISQDRLIELEWACRLGATDCRWEIGGVSGLLQQSRRPQADPFLIAG